MKRFDPSKLHTPQSSEYIGQYVEHPDILYYVKFKTFSVNNPQSYYSNTWTQVNCPCDEEDDEIKEHVECIIFHEIKLKFIIETKSLEGIYYDRKQKKFLMETGRVNYEELFKNLITGTLNGAKFQDYVEVDPKDIVSGQNLAVECLCRQIFVEQYKAGVITKEECEGNSDTKLAEIVRKRNLKRKKKD
jgi:hypothetical protein